MYYGFESKYVSFWDKISKSCVTFLLLNCTCVRSFVFNMYVGTYFTIDKYISIDYNIENIIKKI